MNDGTVGIIMLDTNFPRPVGDIGHPDSFTGPVLYRRVAGASAQQAVRGNADALLAPFIAAGKELLSEGVSVIGTSCGFLSLFQERMEAELSVPVVTSALTLVPKLGKTAGVITIDAQALSERHLLAAGVTWPVSVVGLPKEGELAGAVFNDRPSLDVEKVSAEMSEAAKRLLSENADLESIVFECTNMGPYREVVSEVSGLPVYSVIDAIEARLTK